MTIDVYSKDGCKICEAAKDKLSMMGLAFRTHDLEKAVEYDDGWREDGRVELLAAYAMIDNRLPVIRIGGDYHSYPGAMLRLKREGFDAAADAARNAKDSAKKTAKAASGGARVH